jgi:hypothetical protein
VKRPTSRKVARGKKSAPSTRKRAPAKKRVQKSAAGPGSKPVVRDSPPVDGDLHAAADALFRCAAESCRQHHRVAHLVARAAGDAELQVGWQVAALCDALLKQVTDQYAPIAAQPASTENRELRRSANALWRASRSFTNRFLDEDHLPYDTGREHSSGDFRDLRVRHELDASSILNLKQAVEEYQRVRPAASFMGASKATPRN